MHIPKPRVLFAVAAMAIFAAATTGVHAEEWQAAVGAESNDLGRQALAFLPNEFWVHRGDSIRWTFPTHERHTLSFLTPGQTRPPAFGRVFGELIGCPGITPDRSSFDGSTCLTSGVLLVDDDGGPAPTYTVTFTADGNFKFVCLVHADMTGVIHVVNPSQPLPHDQAFYDQQARSERALLLADASRLHRRGDEDEHEDEDQSQSSVAAGIGETVTTGAGSQTASLMRFVRERIDVRVGDTVEWLQLDPSISHTVTFGTEPADPRPPVNVVPTSDGARQAVIGSPSDSVNSGFLSPTPQDRPNLAQAPPGVTRFRVTFTSPGTFNYICAIHDNLGMTGTVIVHR